MMMTTIEHHLTPDLLMAYSAGTLDEAFALVVATHISMCDSCRAELASFDTVGGCMLNDAGSVEMDESSMDRALAMIASEAPLAASDRPVPVSTGTLPTPLQGYVGGDLDAIRWRPIGMGVKQAILKTQGEAMARLLYIPAGCAVPDHGHNGTELTLVLQGAFSDEADRFARGDVEVADEDVEHTPIADIGEDCICLAATDAPLKFNALVPRLAQRFLRI